MSMWWDGDAKKYRSSLVAKIAYGRWTWPVWRWLMHKLPGDTVEDLKIPLIRFVGRIDEVWCFITAAVLLSALLVIRLLTMLPWFTCDPTTSDRGE